MVTKVYVRREAEIIWDSAGTTQLLTCTSLGAAAGRQGARHDLFGALGAKALRYEWRFMLTPGATRVVGETVEVYLKTWDEGGGRADNDDGTGDIALSAEDKLRNLLFIGSVQIDENVAVEMVASGLVDIGSRYVSPVIFNQTANSLSATASQFEFSLTPLADEIQ